MFAERFEHLLQAFDLAVGFLAMGEQDLLQLRAALAIFGSDFRICRLV